MDFDDFGANSPLGLEFNRREEEVEEEPPLGGIEVVEELNDCGVIEALIADPLADMGVVFLFDMSVVVLLVRSGAGELDRHGTVLEVFDQMPVKELFSVVAVEAKDVEGQGGFNGYDLRKDPGLALTPDRSLLCPAGCDINDIEAEGEHPGHGVVAVSNGIGFQKSGSCRIPLAGFNGDVALKQRAGLGCGESFTLNPEAFFDQEPVDAAGRYASQRCFDPRLQNTEALLVGSNPARQDSLEALGAGVVGA